MPETPKKPTANAIESLRCSAGRAMDKFLRMKEIALNPSAQTSGIKIRKVLSRGLGVLFTTVAITHTSFTIKSAVERPTSTIVTDGYTENLEFPNITICDTFATFINERELMDNYKRRRSGTGSGNALQEEAFDILEWLTLSFLAPDLPEEVVKHRQRRIEVYLGLEQKDINFNKIIDQIERRMNTKNMAIAYRSLVAKHMIPCGKTFRQCSMRGIDFDCCEPHGFLTASITQHGPCWLANFDKIKYLSGGLVFSDNNDFEINIVTWADPSPREVYEKFPKLIEKATIQDELKKPYFLIYLRDAVIATGNDASPVPAWSEVSIGLEALNIVNMANEKKCRQNRPTGPHFFREFERTGCLRNEVLISSNQNASCQIPFLQLVNPSYFNQLESTVPKRPSQRPQCPLFESCPANCKLAPTHITTSLLSEKSSNVCRELCDRILYGVSSVRVSEEEEAVLDNTTLSFGFQEQTYMIFNEFILFTWYDYIGLIGGIWGIWMGASLIDFMQFVEGLGRWAVRKG